MLALYQPDGFCDSATDGGQTEGASQRIVCLTHADFGAAALRQNGVAPDAVELANPLAATHYAESAFRLKDTKLATFSVIVTPCRVQIPCSSAASMTARNRAWPTPRLRAPTRAQSCPASDGLLPRDEAGMRQARRVPFFPRECYRFEGAHIGSDSLS